MSGCGQKEEKRPVRRNANRFRVDLPLPLCRHQNSEICCMQSDGPPIQEYWIWNS